MNNLRFDNLLIIKDEGYRTAISLLSIVFLLFLISSEVMIDNYYLVTSNNQYLKNEAVYKDNIKTIVKSVYDSDFIYSNRTGGYSLAKEYTEKEVIDSIVDGENLQHLVKESLCFFESREEYVENIPNIVPLKSSKYIYVTSLYGTRHDPFTNKITLHGGIDLVSTYKAEIIATADGYIEEHWVGKGHNLYGKLIIVNHRNGYKSAYAHLSESYIREGMIVKKGQVIGRMGNTGRSMGMHLHYEILKNDERIDPMLFMCKELSD